MTPFSQTSYDEHYPIPTTSGDMHVKRRWSTWKKVTGAIQPDSITYDDKTDEDHDASLWDNNDTAFVQEVALERHHQLFGIPTHYSENTIEVVRSPIDTRSGFKDVSSGSRPSSMLAQTSHKRSTSVAGRLSGSGSGSDNSSTFTQHSPGSSKMDLYIRHRPNSLHFSGSHDVSPTTATFSSNRPSPTVDGTPEGWTEEPIEVREKELLSSLPEERPLRRPSTTSATFVSPNMSSKQWKRNASPQVTHHSIEKVSEVVKSKVFYSSNTSRISTSTSTSKRSSIVSGLKRLGGSLRSSSTSKPPPRIPSVVAEKSSSIQPTTIIDEVQIVGAHTNVPMRPSLSPPPLFSQSKISSSPRLTPSPANLGESRSMSENGHYRRQPQTSDHDTEIKRERQGSRIYDKNRYSGLARSSSQRSNIQHTSFDEARRSKGSFNIVDWSMPKAPIPNNIHDEEREELQGEYSPKGGSPRQSFVPSPIRPTRHVDNSSIQLPDSPFSSTRASLELNFNAAHDKRWSQAVSPFQQDRRGSDTSSINASKGFPSHDHRCSITSIASNRTSWQKNSSLNGLGLVQSNSPTLSSTRRTSLGRQASQKASQLIGRPISRNQSVKSNLISRPTSLISTSSNIASTDAFTSDQESIVPFASQQQQHNVVASSLPVKSMATRPTRSAGSIIEVKRPTFGLDLQPDAAAAFDSIPFPRSLRTRTASSPALAGLSISTEDGNLLLGGGITSTIPNEAFPRTPDGEEDSRDEIEGKEEILTTPIADKKNSLSSSITFISPFALSNSQKSPLSDTPQSPVLEDLELLDDDDHSLINSRDTIDTPLDVYDDSLRSIESYTATTTSILSHSRSQDHFQWSEKPIVSQFPRPRSSSSYYTFV